MTEPIDFLTQIPTHWSQVFLAGQTKGDDANQARHKLLVRYNEAVLRYLQRQLQGDEHAARQLYSNFAVRVLEVDAFLRRADPDRGRFRDYLKAVLRRMIIDHYRAKSRDKVGPLIDGSDQEPADAHDDLARLDADFLDCWKQELINQAWKALELTEQRSGQPYFTLLRMRESDPNLRAEAAAQMLSARLGKPFTAVGVRKLTQRGRELLGKLMVDEVARSLRGSAGENVSAERVEQELIELGLLFSYCKDALAEYAKAV